MEHSLDSVIDRIKKFHSKPLPPEDSWYGVGAVYRQLAGLPADFPLRLQMHHGPHIDERPLQFYDNSPLPVLVCRKVFETLHTRRPGKIALACGTAHIWYRRLGAIQSTPDAAGTLAFPSHSTHHIEAVLDHEAYAECLARLPDRFQPVSVSLYWLDLLMGHHLPYVQRGIPVVSAGHMADPNFLEQFYNNLRRHRFATGNELGTHAILAIEMGIPYFHSGPAPVYRDLTGGDPDFNSSMFGGSATINPEQINRPMADKLHRLLPSPDTSLEISDDLRELVSYLHGSDEPLDRAALRRLIVEAYLRTTPAAMHALEVVWADAHLHHRLGLSADQLL